jgi:hypothetical protein
MLEVVPAIASLQMEVSQMSHRLQATQHLKQTSAIKRATPVAPNWPSYQGTSEFVGISPSGRVTVFVDPSLGSPALQNAQDLVNDADRVVTANDQIFGTTGGPVSVIVFALGGATDGTGGADHDGCDYTTGAAIEVCASFGNSARVSALFEAELSECSMGGNLCGVSTGEALSRWCAAVIGSNALSDFATAPTWLNDGMPNYVDQTDPTDQNADSTGCGMAFISWLLSQGISLSQIAQGLVALTANGTFAQLYANLTSQPQGNAWPTFQAAVRALPNGVNNDDPFGGAAQPAQLAHLAPWTVELAGKIFAAILADVAAGKPEHQVVASVRAALVASPATRAQPAYHRLVPSAKGARA